MNPLRLAEDRMDHKHVDPLKQDVKSSKIPGNVFLLLLRSFHTWLFSCYVNSLSKISNYWSGKSEEQTL